MIKIFLLVFDIETIILVYSYRQNINNFDENSLQFGEKLMVFIMFLFSLLYVEFPLFV